MELKTENVEKVLVFKAFWCGLLPIEPRRKQYYVQKCSDPKKFLLAPHGFSLRENECVIPIDRRYNWQAGGAWEGIWGG